MSSSLKNIILVGASGNLGAPLLQALVAGPFNVSVLARQSSTARFPDGVTVHRTDYTPESLAAAFSEKDAVISTVNDVGLADQIKLIDAAIAAGVKRFLPSEFGSDHNDPQLLEAVPPYHGKKGITDYLKTKEKDGLTWTSIISGAFFDWCLRVGFLGFDLGTQTATIFDDGTALFRGTALSSVTQAVIGVLSHPEETANRFIYVSSLITNQKSILAALEKASGKQWAVKHIDSAEKLRADSERFAKGDHSAVLDMIQASLLSGMGRGNGPDSNELLGLQACSLEEMVERVVQGE